MKMTYSRLIYSDSDKPYITTIQQNCFDSDSICKIHKATQIVKYAGCCTAQKMKFCIKDFFSKCEQIRSFLRICSHLLKKSLMQNFIFCAVLLALVFTKISWHIYKLQY